MGVDDRRADGAAGRDADMFDAWFECSSTTRSSIRAR